MVDETPQLAMTVAPTADEGVRCPQCGYNLTGLPEPRCPECGTAFDWAAVRQAAANPPQIYFERVRGWRKVPGIFVTWATVLFAPWVFARQAVRRMSTGHAVAFAALCFVSTVLSMVVGNAEPSFMATWLTTAFVYLLIQAVCLSAVDCSGWRKPANTLRFWLLVGCYLSAVMPTEIFAGPPPVFMSDLGEFVGARSLRSLFVVVSSSSTDCVIWWVQMLAWLFGLGCCYYVRLGRRRWTGAVLLPAALLVMAGLFVLYAAVLEYIGTPLAHWYGI